MPRSTLAIEFPHPEKQRFSYGPKVLLNGEEVPGLREITVQWELNCLPVATLTIGLDKIDIDAEALLQIRALMQAQQQLETRPTVVAPLPGDE